MSLRPILIIPDKRLKIVSEPVAGIDDGVRALVKEMFETMYDAPGIGLAAIQIGVARRIVTIDVAQKDTGERNPIALINPEIVSASAERSVYEEGCLSIPDYFAEVERPAAVKLRYTSLEGETVETDAEGLLATCVQHEIDHLDGVLFIDHLSRLKRERVKRRFDKLARQRDE